MDSQRVDAYILFVEAALNLVREGGFCGFVVPNAFLRSTTAVRLRELLEEKADVLEVIDFLDQPVFQGVGIYICLLLFRKRMHEASRPQVTTAKIYRLSATPSAQLARLSVTSDPHTEGHEVFHASQPEGKAPWIFRNPTEDAILHSMQKNSERLGKALEIRQGVKTGADAIFIIDAPSVTELNHLVEAELLIPVLRNRELRRWCSRPAAYLIYPYNRQSKKIIDLRTLEKKFPRACSYLLRNKPVLDKRRSLRGKQWYELIEPRLHTIASEQKTLYIAELSLRPIVTKALSSEAAIVGSTGGGSWIVLPPSTYEQFSMMAYLNSAVAEWYFRQVSSMRRGGWLVVEQHLIQGLPLPLFLRDSQSFARHQIGQLAEQLFNQMGKASGVPDTALRKEIESIEEQVDALVIEALGLSAPQGEYVRARAIGLRKAGAASEEVGELTF
jgi:hypothetical protein